MRVSKETRQTIGKRLLQYIDLRNISQDELAIQCGVSRPTINNIVNGKSSASSELLATMSSVYFDFNINWLVTGRGEMLLNQEDSQENYAHQEYTFESLFELIKEKNETIDALKNTVESKNETIKALQETISSKNEILSILKGGAH